MKRCVIICGSPDFDIDFVRGFVEPGDYVICADSGYALAEQADISPDLLVGDFDSYSGELPDDIERISLKIRKDDTDSMHCAEVALKRGFRDVVLLCAFGGRLDHSLGNLSVLRYIAENGARASAESPDSCVFCLSPGEKTFTEFDGKTFSALPAFCESAVISYPEGADYPASSLELMGSQTVGISNVVRGEKLRVRVESGYVFLIFNKKL